MKLFIMSLFILTPIKLTEIKSQDHSSAPEAPIFTERFRLSAGNVHIRDDARIQHASPTKIRFNNNLKSMKFDEIIRNSREHADNMILNPIVSFSHLRPKLAKQMAPAYELWPNLKENNNILSSDSKKIKSQVEPCNIPKISERFAQNSSPPVLGRMRNLLPKPVTILSSGTSTRSIKIRSVTNNGHNRTDVNNANVEEEEETVDDDNSNNNNNNNDQTGTNENQMANDTEDSRGVEPDEQQLPNKFKVFDGKQASVRSESKRFIESPVYPPGDLDRLYSDALLVYVKDFNQFITE